MFTSLEFRLSAVVAWQELGLQYRGAVALARNVRILSRAFLILHRQQSLQCGIRVLAVWDRVCTQAANVWIFRSFQQRYVRNNRIPSEEIVINAISEQQSANYFDLSRL